MLVSSGPLRSRVKIGLCEQEILGIPSGRGGGKGAGVGWKSVQTAVQVRPLQKERWKERGLDRKGLR